MKVWPVWLNQSMNRRSIRRINRCRNRKVVSACEVIDCADKRVVLFKGRDRKEWMFVIVNRNADGERLLLLVVHCCSMVFYLGGNSKPQYSMPTIVFPLVLRPA